MNCKQGDLAIVTRSRAGNNGLVLTCLSFAGYVLTEMPDGSLREMAMWNVDRPVRQSDGLLCMRCHDEVLTPLRGHGEDSMTDEQKAEGARASAEFANMMLEYMGRFGGVLNTRNRG